jgi:hypothetical protein
MTGALKAIVRTEAEQAKGQHRGIEPRGEVSHL